MQRCSSDLDRETELPVKVDNHVPLLVRGKRPRCFSWSDVSCPPVFHDKADVVG